MYKNLMISLLCLNGLLALLIPGAAAEDIFIWDRYNLSLPVPDGWVAVEDGDRLLLGYPDDVDALLVNGQVNNLVVMMQVVLPEDGPEDTLAHYTGLMDGREVEVEMQTYGDRRYPSALFSMERYAGMLVLVGDQVLVTAFAPTGQWAAAQESAVALIAQIAVEPMPLSRLDHLTGFEWRGLRLMIPDSWQANATRSRQQVILTRRTDMIMLSASFHAHHLMIVLNDYSHLRPLITPESLPDDLAILRPIYLPRDYEITEPLAIETGGEAGDAITIARLGFSSSFGTGEIWLILTPDQAFIVMGMAGDDLWQASEADLFAALMATLEISPTAAR